MGFDSVFNLFLHFININNIYVLEIPKIFFDARLSVFHCNFSMTVSKILLKIFYLNCWSKSYLPKLFLTLLGLLIPLLRKWPIFSKIFPVCSMATALRTNHKTSAVYSIICLVWHEFKISSLTFTLKLFLHIPYYCNSTFLMQLFLDIIVYSGVKRIYTCQNSNKPPTLVFLI